LIISHRHQFVFFAVPKTGTHAIRQALGPHLAAGDWEQQDLFERKRLPIPELAQLRHGHISVRQLQPLLPAGQWESYFKFAFVRNPFDRFVSTCFFLRRNQPGMEQHAAAFMRQAIRTPRFRQRILVQPQSALLTDASGRVVLDYVGRFENLQESCNEAFARIGLPAADLARRNTSRHEEYSSYYDDELRRAVADYYRADFDNFGYDANRSY
jgi:hypothetical protein